MFCNLGHQQSSEVAKQHLEVALCAILDPTLWFDVIPMQAHLGFHREDIDSPCPVPVLLPNICTRSLLHRTDQLCRVRPFSLPTQLKSGRCLWNESWPSTLMLREFSSTSGSRAGERGFYESTFRLGQQEIFRNQKPQRDLVLTCFLKRYWEDPMGGYGVYSLSRW